MNKDLSNDGAQLQLDPDVTREMQQVKTSQRITGGTEGSGERRIEDEFEVDLGQGLVNEIVGGSRKEEMRQRNEGLERQR